MKDFLEPIFDFMEGNFVLLNMLILYGVPTLVFIIGAVLRDSQSKSIKIIGILLILISGASCIVLSIYALKYGIIFTGLLGLVWAGSIFYYFLFPAELKDDN
ncbi:MAG: hypothetical protein LBP63_03985 [Prevotellaceae bacterium]|jgi:hypothetical protein|nr:hypothetical protein [Prevotellaceae bacterium]